MEFSEVVASLARGAGVVHAQAAIRGAYGRGASRWLAQEQGISPRTARRWLSGNYPRGRARAITDAASGLGAGPIAAQRIAQASNIIVGKVRVAYRGASQQRESRFAARDEGSRRIGRVRIRSATAEHLSDAMQELLSGKIEHAAEAFSDAVIAGYEDGLEETLSISDYSDGIELEE